VVAAAPRRDREWAGAVVPALSLLLLLLALLFPGVAHAWRAEQTTNGLLLTREASDVSTYSVSVYRYWDYKGGDSTWTLNNGGNVPGLTTSYNSSDYFALGTTWTSIEVPYKSGYVLQLFRIAQTGSQDWLYAVMNKGTRLGNPASQTSPFLVTQSEVPTTPVSVVGTLPVTLDSSQSLSISSASTLPVTLSGIGDPGADGAAYLDSIAGLLALLSGFFFVGVVKR